MSLEPTRKSPSSDEDDALLDADLLAIFGDTPDQDEPTDPPESAQTDPEILDDEDAEADEEVDLDEQPSEPLDESDPLDDFQPFSDLPDEEPSETTDEQPLHIPEEPAAPAYAADDRPKVTPPRKRATEDAYRVYLLKNLSSAQTAIRIEEKIRKLSGISDVVVVYATQQLRFLADDPDARLDQIRRICMSIDPSVELVPLSDTPRSRQEFHKPGELRNVIAGVVCLVVGALVQIFLPQFPLVSLFILCLSYVILGGDTLLSALGILKNGRVFDANVLLSLATLGVIAMGSYIEAALVMLIYRAGMWFEQNAVAKNRRQILNAVDLRPEVVHRIDNEGVVHTIPAAQAQVGDLLLIRPGDRIPLDGIVRAGQSRLDTSPITGDAAPMAVGPDVPIVSGCVNGTGALQLEVTHALPDALVTRILEAVESATADKSQMERRFTHFSRIYTPVIVLLAVLTALVPSFLTGEWGRWVHTGLTFLVVSYPGALILSVPLALFSGIGAGAEHGILFRGGSVLESLKHIHTVALEQHSTLSRGKMEVQAVIPAPGMNESALLSMAASCERSADHPFARCIRMAAQERNMQIVAPSKVQEIPNQGIVAMISGVTVLCGHRSLLETAHVDLSGYVPSESGTDVLVAAGGRYAGVLRITEAVKPGIKTTMKRLRALGLTTVLMTEASAEHAEALASQLDIQEVKAEVAPDQADAALEQIQSAHGSVLYVSNHTDSEATVTAVMGPDAPSALQTADLVFLTTDPQAICHAFDLSHLSLRAAQQNVILALAVKLIILLLGFAGIASLWLAVLLDTIATVVCLQNALRVLSPKN